MFTGTLFTLQFHFDFAIYMFIVLHRTFQGDASDSELWEAAGKTTAMLKWPE